VTFIVGAGPGGGNDLYARLLARYMPLHILGKPTLVIQNMPAAAGVGAANYMYNVAPKDGSVIATIPSGVFLAEAISPSQIQFNSLKFSWIGTIATTTDLLAVLKSSGIATLEQAKQKTAVVGATSPYALSALEPALANAFVGTKFRIVNGYSDSGDTLNLAMERNEIDGRTNQWASWKVLRPDWIRDNKLSYLLQFGPKAADLRNVPTLGDLVDNPDDKAVVGLLEVAQYVGRSVFGPPDIPSERLALLRKAFEETMRDEGFIGKLRQARLDFDPRTAIETHKSIARSMDNREAVVARLKSKVGVK
jgi:tripartite-type tricarboxylate transporter receptor subunit TctC